MTRPVPVRVRIHWIRTGSRPDPDPDKTRIWAKPGSGPNPDRPDSDPPDPTDRDLQDGTGPDGIRSRRTDKDRRIYLLLEAHTSPSTTEVKFDVTQDRAGSGSAGTSGSAGGFGTAGPARTDFSKIRVRKLLVEREFADTVAERISTRNRETTAGVYQSCWGGSFEPGVNTEDWTLSRPLFLR
jgi:hypothetical protein